MYEPPGLVKIDGPLGSPQVQPFPVGALMSCEVKPGIPPRCLPPVGDEADVRMAHGALPQEVKTVLCSIVLGTVSRRGERRAASGDACGAVGAWIM